MPFANTGSLRRKLETRDADEAMAFFAGGVRPGTVTSSSEIRIDSQYYLAADLMTSAMTTSADWQFRPKAELDAISVWISCQGSIGIEHDGRRATVAPGSLIMTSARTNRCLDMETPFEGYVLGVCSTVVRQEMSSFLGYDVTADFDFLTEASMQTRLGSTLAALGSSLHCGLTGELPLLASPIGLKRYRDALVNMMLMTAGGDKVREWGALQSASARQLRRAEEFMRANAHLPIGVVDVANHIGVSVRALQYAFKQHRGTTPLSCLQLARLEGVRQALKQGEPGTIAAIAARWGFTHAGRFSRQYRAAFGEKPSFTASFKSGRAE